MKPRANACRAAAAGSAAVACLLAGCRSVDPSSGAAEVEPAAAELVAAPAELAQPVLVRVTISPEARVRAAAGDAPRVLRQGGWSEFSVAIENAAGITAPLVIESEQFMSGKGDAARDRWLRLETLPAGPLTGKDTETRRLRLFSRDAGTRTAVLSFNAGQGTQDLGFRADVLLTFKVAAAPAPTADTEGPSPAR